MEAIKAIAKKNKKGVYKIELPPETGVEDVMDVMVIIEKVKKIRVLDLKKFAGKMESKIDWVAYQKKIRNEWE